MGARGLPAADPCARADALAAGERLVRVPPKLMAPQRRAGRTRGKSDPIDALAVARAALREPRLDHPRPGEQRLRELKLLVDHRDDLIDERRRAQQRLRWHLHDLDPDSAVPLGALDRAVWLDRVGRRLARLEQTAQVRIARELLGRCRSLTRTIGDLDRELQRAAAQTAPALLALPGCGADQRRQAARRDRPDRALRLRRAACPPRRRRTARSELRQTPTPPARPRRQPPTQLRPAPDRDHPRHASTRPHAPTSNANKPKARADAKHSAASNDNSHAPSTPPSRTSPP